MLMPILASFNINVCFKALGDGDTSGFETFFEAYKKRVFGVALKMLKSETEAEEIVQEVFLSIWQSRARLGDINDPEAYLFTITYNAIYSQLRKISRNLQLINRVVQQITEKQNSAEEVIAAHETDRMIREALLHLPPQQRTIYELNKLQGLSYHEIAECMHLSQNTVRNHLSVATKTIRGILKKWVTFFIFISDLLL
ncbi:MAG: RNA polymerase sigma-70 factor [Chitinophagaceae bacterium]|nr:RNA polymerase sigma-70 factor [Chitinophagaceae bacterium]